jgi:hypothetical protein
MPRAVRLLLVLALGCDDLRLHVEQPVAVGATTILQMSNSRITCDRNFRCTRFGGSIESIEMDPEGIFEEVGAGAARTLLAVAAGETKIDVVGAIGGDRLREGITVEAADPARVELAVFGGFVVDRFVLRPGTTALFESRVYDEADRVLVSTGLLTATDPSGRIATAIDGSSLRVTASAEGETTLVALTGEMVAAVRVTNEGAPEAIQVWVPDAHGLVVPVRVVGTSGSDVYLFDDLTVTIEIRTPEVCKAPDGGTAATFSLGTTLDLILAAPGKCEVFATVPLSNGSIAEGTGSGRVAPVIRRFAEE